VWPLVSIGWVVRVVTTRAADEEASGVNNQGCIAHEDPRLVGDPADTLTGAVTDRMLDFRLTGPIELRWYRHYDSSQCHRSFSLGRGCAHEYDRSLKINVDGYLYEEPVGRVCKFPPLNSDGESCLLHGFTFRRISSTCYRMLGHARPAMEFSFSPGSKKARLTRLIQGLSEVRFYYNTVQQLIGIADSAGRLITATEDDHGRLVRLLRRASADKPEGLLIDYHYDEYGNLIATKYAAGHGYTFVYDENNRMVLRRGRKGFQFHFKYDEQGRCIRAMGDERVYGVALEYTVPGRVTHVTRPDMGRWTYRFGSRGDLQEIHDPLGGVQKFIRDATDRLAVEIDANGNASKLVYDVSGCPIEKVDPLGNRIALPQVPDAPDPLYHRVAGNAAEYEYGRLIDVSRITLPDKVTANELPITIEARSLVFTKVDVPQPGLEQQFEVSPIDIYWWPEPKSSRIFNDFGDLTAQRDDFGRLRRWTYDPSGNRSE